MGRIAMLCAGGWLWLALLLQPARAGDPVALQGADLLRLSGVAILSVDGRPLCTAVLIAPDQAVTAAHCVANRDTGDQVSPAALTLTFRPGTDQASIARVAALAVPPDIPSTAPVQSLADLTPDLALLILASALGPDQAQPLSVEPWPDPIGAFVDIAGYERDGPPGLWLREGCMGVEAGSGVALVTCDVVAGLSGAPVLLQGRPEDAPRLVATVSSRGQGAAFVVAIAPHLPTLRAQVAR